MIIGVPKEIRVDERRVAATPETVKKLCGLGHGVRVQAGAGAGAFIRDADFAAAGAEIVPDLAAVYDVDMVLKVQRPRLMADGVHEADLLRESSILVSVLSVHEDPEILTRLSARKITAVALEAVPRIARAQKMDVLSSMANIAGYRAVMEAAGVFGRFLPLLMTAAGTVPPAQVLVIGAGVAGLSAIATAKRLGAVVKAFDLRPAVKDQIKSVGAEFVTLDLGDFQAEDKGGYAKSASDEILRREQELFLKLAPQTDIVVSTALVPGRKAPLLFTTAAVEALKPGSVIVDLAAEQGGNCELTRAGEAVEHRGVTILGYTNLPSRMAMDASRLYARNLYNLVHHFHGKQGFHLDLNEEVTGACVIIHQGQVRGG